MSVVCKNFMLTYKDYDVVCKNFMLMYKDYDHGYHETQAMYPGIDEARLGHLVKEIQRFQTLKQKNGKHPCSSPTHTKPRQ